MPCCPTMGRTSSRAWWPREMPTAGFVSRLGPMHMHIWSGASGKRAPVDCKRLQFFFSIQISPKLGQMELASACGSFFCFSRGKCEATPVSGRSKTSSVGRTKM